jgi:hypothetical protein
MARSGTVCLKRGEQLKPPKKELSAKLFGGEKLS